MACVAAMTAGGGASTLDKRTLFTFNKPIALPHMTLPSGTYMFRLASPMSAENFIEVADARGLESYGVFMTRQIMRDRGAKEAVTFKETAPGRPMAVEAWWYSGDKYGYEFIYGKDSMPAPVATTSDVRQPDIVMSSLAPLAVTPPAVTERVEQTPQPAAQPAPTPRTDPAPAPAPAPAAAERTELPRTAGPLPIAFLAGFGALALGFALSRRGRRVRVRS
jgi:hypothetical protein